MDRRGARRLVLIALAVGSGATAAEPPLRDARWLASGRDPVAAFAYEPTECLARPADHGQAQAIEIGRAAFRTPLLLGGQAARAGLSCASCHRGGRGNPDFFFPGLSGPPGTSDVTSSLTSSHRGDGRRNARPIPVLSGSISGLRVDREPGGRALETFVRGLIVEEFDGAEPPPRVVAGLAAYVRALQPSACPPAAVKRARVADELENVTRSLAAAEAALATSDVPTAKLMVAAARSALGRIDERYAVPGLSPHRAALRDADRALAAISLGEEGMSRARGDLQRWRAGMTAWTKPLRRDEPRSLYARRPLARAFAPP